jgi:hypothetical protein
MEDIRLHHLWTHLPYEDIINLCQVSLDFSVICSNNTTWIFLLKRDFGIDYTEPNARNMYLKYHNTLAFFSETFPIITKKALDYIVEYIPDTEWNEIIDFEQWNRDEGNVNQLLKLGKFVTDPYEIGSEVERPYSDKFYENPLMHEMIKPVLQNGCNEILKLATRPTVIFIDGKIRIVNYDDDLAYELYLILDGMYNMDCYDIVRDIENRLISLL